MRVLFRLYRESEQDQDYLSSTTATSVYEAFLLHVVCVIAKTNHTKDTQIPNKKRNKNETYLQRIMHTSKPLPSHPQMLFPAGPHSDTRKCALCSLSCFLPPSSEVYLFLQAQTLRDTFPASDKSLGRLLAEVPFLSEGVLHLLESLCFPENKEGNDKDFQSGDRVTQGLSVVWSLILLRPADRDRCLQIALQV